jgi:pyruvate ferredoxin oxidoreductase beta subunit
VLIYFSTVRNRAYIAGVFPIYEVIDGNYKLNINRPQLKPVADYLKSQGRFRHLPDAEIQERVTQEYLKIKGKATGGGE